MALKNAENKKSFLFLCQAFKTETLLEALHQKEIYEFLPLDLTIKMIPVLPALFFSPECVKYASISMSLFASLNRSTCD